MSREHETVGETASDAVVRPAGFPPGGAAASYALPRLSVVDNNPMRAAYTSARQILSQVITPRDERARAQSNAVKAFSVRVISAALLYVMQIVLARWMGSFEYGIYVFVWTWVLILGGLSPIGLNVMAIRLIPEYRERGQTSLLRGLTFGSRLAAFGIGTVVALFGMVGLYFGESYIANYYVLPAYLALVCIPIYAVGDVQDGIGRGQAWMGLALVPPYILRPLLILAFMVGAFAADLPMAATTAAGAAILATWTAGLVQMLLMNIRLSQIDEDDRGNSLVPQAVDGAVDDQNRSYDFSTWLKISAPLLIISACDLLLQNTDVIIISQYMSPSQVGIYFAAAKTMSLIMFVHYAVGSAVANRFSALKARGDEEGLKRFVGDAVNWTFWPSLASAIILLALGKPLLSLFGPQFVTEGYPVMLILVVGFLFRSAIGPADFLLNMLGEQRLCAAVLVAAAILNIVLNLTMVPLYGANGAACATAVSLVTAALLHYGAVRYRLGLDVAIWSNWLPRRNQMSR